MKKEDYPAIYVNSDRASHKTQNYYLFLIASQYALLFVASISGALSIYTTNQAAAVLYFCAVLGAAALLLFSISKAPEKDWYSARALAESVKTLSWRYMMRSDPFDSAIEQHQADEIFCSNLAKIIDINRGSADSLSKTITVGPQISNEMRRIRNMEIEERRRYYLNHRVTEQLNWYHRKVHQNQTMSRIFSTINVFVYAAAIAISGAFALELKALPIGANVQSYSEPLLIVAASLIGWMQAKRYSELSASYTLAVHEIARIKDNISRVKDDADLAQFVTESETAFSREHTQWAARQSTGIQ